MKKYIFSKGKIIKKVILFTLSSLALLAMHSSYAMKPEIELSEENLKNIKDVRYFRDVTTEDLKNIRDIDVLFHIVMGTLPAQQNSHEKTVLCRKSGHTGDTSCQIFDEFKGASKFLGYAKNSQKIYDELKAKASSEILKRD